MELMVLSDLIISTMTTWTYGAMSGANLNSICDNSTYCIFNSTVSEQIRSISSLVLIVIILIFALIIILTKALHTASKWNTIIMIITLIIMMIGVGLLTPCVDTLLRIISSGWVCKILNAVGDCNSVNDWR
ncbi:unnamed protein product [Schistosoma turkestanicum]|nr:unnamed protein product [Schistosoma turkestanicum]